ncbi:cyd operon YbgE family protein [Cellvibrio sp. UBA7661]|uniref:cyd operon YbgE family protein n=1 Tax=Cellvibrio sp. UBA7661 TaxID=1946311 RepID=UPI002F35CD25
MSKPAMGNSPSAQKNKPATEPVEKPAPLDGGRVLVFCLSLMVMVLITAWPHFLGSTPDTMDHNAAMVLMFGMSCGFVYGIGFTPKLRIWRWLFSGWSAVVFMCAGVAMVVT